MVKIQSMLMRWKKQQVGDNVLRLRKKLKKQDGFTLVEMIAATLVLALLGMMLNTGVAVARTSYQQVTTESETQLLLSTVSNLLYNELRYARDVVTDGSDQLERYTSVSFGRNTVLSLPSTGQIMANNKRMLATGAYGNGSYKISSLNITFIDGVFNVELAISDKTGVQAQNEFSVRCINY